MVKAPYNQLLRPRAVAPAGCPVDHGFSPYRSDYLKNPYPGLRARLWLTGIALSVTAAMMLTARLGQTTLWADGEVTEIWQAVRDWRLWLIGGAVGVVLRRPATFLAFWAIHRHGADAYILATALLPFSAWPWNGRWPSPDGCRRSRSPSRFTPLARR